MTIRETVSMRLVQFAKFRVPKTLHDTTFEMSTSTHGNDPALFTTASKSVATFLKSESTAESIWTNSTFGRALRASVLEFALRKVPTTR